MAIDKFVYILFSIVLIIQVIKINDNNDALVKRLFIPTQKKNIPFWIKKDNYETIINGIIDSTKK